jgi:hypothetical protein
MTIQNIQNPNEYDDEAYSDAAGDLYGEEVISDHAMRLWQAGGTIDDIRTEFAEAVNNAIMEITVVEEKEKK